MLAAGTGAQASFSAVLIGLPVLAPALREKYDLTLSEVGLLLSSVWLGPILTLLPWGLLADRLGERVVLATGLATAGVLVALAGLSSRYWVLVVLLIIAGGAGASVNAASGRAVMQWFGADERGLALGLRQTAIPVGGAVAALALPAIDDAAGLEAAFAVLGALCIVSAGVAAAAIRERIAAPPELDAESVPWTLRDSRLWVLSTGSGLYLTAQLAFTAFVVLFLHDARGVGAGAAAAVLAALQVCAIVTRISAGRLSDTMRARVRPLRWIGLASGAGALLAAALTDAPLAVLVPALVVAGAISMAWNGLSVTAAAELAGRAKSGAAIGFQQTTLAIIGVAVPALFAVLVEALGWRAGFALASIGPFVGWAMLGRLSEISP